MCWPITNTYWRPSVFDHTQTNLFCHKGLGPCDRRGCWRGKMEADHPSLKGAWERRRRRRSCPLSLDVSITGAFDLVFYKWRVLKTENRAKCLSLWRTIQRNSCEILKFFWFISKIFKLLHSSHIRRSWWTSTDGDHLNNTWLLLRSAAGASSLCS